MTKKHLLDVRSVRHDLGSSADAKMGAARFVSDTMLPKKTLYPGLDESLRPKGRSIPAKFAAE